MAIVVNYFYCINAMKEKSKYRLLMKRAGGWCEPVETAIPNSFRSSMAELTVGHDGRARYSVLLF